MPEVLVTTQPTEPSPIEASPRPTWPPLTAYARILLGAILVTAAELLLKRGATASADRAALLGTAALGSYWTWAGIAVHITAMVNWLAVLRRVPLATAFSLVSIQQALVPLAAWGCMGETISPRRWVGITLVLCGIAAVARSYARAEEKL